MKFGINNPAFLQAAGFRKEKEMAVLTFASGTADIFLASNGAYSVRYTLNGVLHEEKRTGGDFHVLTLSVDPHTPVYLIGTITRITGTQDNYTLENLEAIDVTTCKSLKYLWIDHSLVENVDLQNNTELEWLNVDNCRNLKSLDVSKNSKLDILNFYGCSSIEEINLFGITDLRSYSPITSYTESLKSIKGWAVNETMKNRILSLAELGSTSGLVVTLRRGDEYNSALADELFRLDTVVEYVDA